MIKGFRKSTPEADAANSLGRLLVNFYAAIDAGISPMAILEPEEARALQEAASAIEVIATDFNGGRTPKPLEKYRDPDRWDKQMDISHAMEQQLDRGGKPYYLTLMRSMNAAVTQVDAVKGANLAATVEEAGAQLV